MGPRNVVNGLSRVLGKDRNAWTPAADQDGPHWLQLRLPKAAEIDTVHLTFENHPTAVQVQIASDDGWTTVETGPMTRRRNVLRFPSIQTDKVRLFFTNGASRPAVCEVRLYHDR